MNCPNCGNYKHCGKCRCNKCGDNYPDPQDLPQSWWDRAYKNWTPTSENINNLPGPVKSHIEHLEGLMVGTLKEAM